MPFDGSSMSPELRILGALLEFFEDDDRWVQEMFNGVALLIAVTFARFVAQDQVV